LQKQGPVFSRPASERAAIDAKVSVWWLDAAAIEIERLQDPEVALILDVTMRVARGPIEVDDPDIQAMCRIEFGAADRACSPRIRAQM
jgi:hypothetical protein